jgi:nickel transport protein
MRRMIAAAALLTALTAAHAGAHGIRHTVTRGDTIVVELAHESDAPFSDEHYQVFRPGEDEPFQAGRTDQRGRISFVPDRDGEWRVRAFSEDGHGVDLVVPAQLRAVAVPPAEPPVESPVERSRFGRPVRILVGVVILFALFGVAAQFLRRRSP